MDGGPPRLDGSDKFFGMENVGRPNSTCTPSLAMRLEAAATTSQAVMETPVVSFSVLTVVSVIGREWGKIWKHLVGPPHPSRM